MTLKGPPGYIQVNLINHVLPGYFFKSGNLGIWLGSLGCPFASVPLLAYLLLTKIIVCARIHLSSFRKGDI